MRENVGRADQTLRSFVGPFLLYAGYDLLNGKRGTIGGIAAMVFGALITESAITKTCPLNALLGIDTRRKTRAVRVQKRVDRIRKQIEDTGVPKKARDLLLH